MTPRTKSRSVSGRAAGHTASAPTTTPAAPAAKPKMLLQPERIRMMWLAVVATMVLIVGAWVLTLFWKGFDRSSGENPIHDIYEQVKGAFTDDAPATFNVEPANEARLEDLRSRVFPEFTEPPAPNSTAP
ncbi:MAG: hypothetical protein HY340_03475 [Candidatus Kerfeldbacteria bacterium]|nr:hypothetical protein [Candidatus Kerfeldbacteria bacterium]